jgi:hypothetical protein
MNIYYCVHNNQLYEYDEPEKLLVARFYCQEGNEKDATGARYFLIAEYARKSHLKELGMIKIGKL